MTDAKHLARFARLGSDRLASTVLSTELFEPNKYDSHDLGRAVKSAPKSCKCVQTSARRRWALSRCDGPAVTSSLPRLVSTPDVEEGPLRCAADGRREDTADHGEF